mgnify:CR=1 FL=1|jgi:protein-arginine kinase activator protein McsA
MTEETHKKNHDEQHLEKLTVKELREIAAQFPHEKAIHDMKKEELVAFIRQAKGIEEPHVHRHKPKGKIKLSREEIKARIRQMKSKIADAMDAHEKKRAAFLRHQMNKFKKKSRRLAAA